MATKIHESAIVSNDAKIGEDSQIWNHSQVREGAVLGQGCILGKNVYIDFGVIIGNRVKIQNNAGVYHGATVEDGAFIGPGVILTNDPWPRSINSDGSLKGNADWNEAGVTLKRRSSIGALSVICPGVTVGILAMVGAGSVVTKDVPDFALVFGNPARVQGWVCSECGEKLNNGNQGDTCEKCRKGGVS